MSNTTLTDICFENFALHPLLLKGLEESGFIRCTPIQAMTLPLTLEGRDVAGQAQTGTGKTAAFLVALFNRLLMRDAHPERRTEDPRAVVLAPTRELAVQIEKDAVQIGRHTGLRTALIYGGVDYDKQRKLLEDGVDVIIATPGRLIDFVKQNTVSFRAIEMMVMDEADRMFDLGFIKDIRFLLRKMPGAGERQNLLFSATLSHRVLELAYEHMNDPEKLVVEADSITASNVRQIVYFPATEEKMPLLLGLLSKIDANRSIVFVNTKYGCERVALTLERAGYKVGVLSGDVPQKKRESLLARFVRGELNMLVATDVAARGLHIPAVSHVFNYDLPLDPEDYVHRIGRTARLGAEGDAISFACDEYAIGLPDIEKFIEQKIPVGQFDASLLLPVPRGRAASAGQEGESVVEDALREASEERRRRRERDQRDGRRSDGRGPRSGDSRRSSSGRSGGEPRPERGPAPTDRPAAPPPVRAASGPETARLEGVGDEPRRKRRRSRSRKPGEETGAVPANGQAWARPSGREKTGASLGSRIKSTIKSWLRRLGMPRKGR
ncbi:MAG: DEAD/DEAH box helicase [Gammaproteobacteria bacterium]|nr:DEAD/DEAH box helicase [Gammaproteobacteria bacterium]